MYLRGGGRRFLMGGVGCWTSLVVAVVSVSLVEGVTSWQMRRSPPSLEDGVIERGRGDEERSRLKRKLWGVAMVIAAAGCVVNGLDSAMTAAFASICKPSAAFKCSLPMNNGGGGMCMSCVE